MRQLIYFREGHSEVSERVRHISPSGVLSHTFGCSPLGSARFAAPKSQRRGLASLRPKVLSIDYLRVSLSGRLASLRRKNKRQSLLRCAKKSCLLERLRSFQDECLLHCAQKPYCMTPSAVPRRVLAALRTKVLYYKSISHSGGPLASTSSSYY